MAKKSAFAESPIKLLQMQNPRPPQSTHLCAGRFFRRFSQFTSLARSCVSDWITGLDDLSFEVRFSRY